MSAFEVSDTHIDILISAALQRGQYGDPLGWYHAEIPRTAPGEALPGHEDYITSLNRTRREVTSENAETWGATLLAENRRSVNHRYDEDEIEEPYVFTEYAGSFKPAAILKALDCYEYQSCEHPGWEASEAHSFCEALRSRMIHQLPGYADAPWEVHNASDVMTGEAIQLRQPVRFRRSA